MAGRDFLERGSRRHLIRLREGSTRARFGFSGQRRIRPVGVLPARHLMCGDVKILGQRSAAI